MKYISSYLKLRIEGDYAVVMTNEYQLFLLNRIGYEVLRLITEHQDLDDIIQHLSDVFGIDFKLLEKDINDYIEYMEENKIVQKEG